MYSSTKIGCLEDIVDVRSECVDPRVIQIPEELSRSISDTKVEHLAKFMKDNGVMRAGIHIVVTPLLCRDECEEFSKKDEVGADKEARISLVRKEKKVFYVVDGVHRLKAILLLQNRAKSIPGTLLPFRTIVVDVLVPRKPVKFLSKTTRLAFSNHYNFLGDQRSTITTEDNLYSVSSTLSVLPAEKRNMPISDLSEFLTELRILASVRSSTTMRDYVVAAIAMEGAESTLSKFYRDLCRNRVEGASVPLEFLVLSRFREQNSSVKLFLMQMVAGRVAASNKYNRKRSGAEVSAIPVGAVVFRKQKSSLIQDFLILVEIVESAAEESGKPLETFLETHVAQFKGNWSTRRPEGETIRMYACAVAATWEIGFCAAQLQIFAERLHLSKCIPRNIKGIIRVAGKRKRESNREEASQEVVESTAEEQRASSLKKRRDFPVHLAELHEWPVTQYPEGETVADSQSEEAKKERRGYVAASVHKEVHVSSTAKVSVPVFVSVPVPAPAANEVELDIKEKEQVEPDQRQNAEQDSDAGTESEGEEANVDVTVAVSGAAVVQSNRQKKTNTEDVEVQLAAAEVTDSEVKAEEEGKPDSAGEVATAGPAGAESDAKDEVRSFDEVEEQADLQNGTQPLLCPSLKTRGSRVKGSAGTEVLTPHSPESEAMVLSGQEHSQKEKDLFADRQYNQVARDCEKEAYNCVLPYVPSTIPSLSRIRYHVETEDCVSLRRHLEKAWKIGYGADLYSKPELELELQGFTVLEEFVRNSDAGDAIERLISSWSRHFPPKCCGDLEEYMKKTADCGWDAIENLFSSKDACSVAQRYGRFSICRTKFCDFQEQYDAAQFTVKCFVECYLGMMIENIDGGGKVEAPCTGCRLLVAGEECPPQAPHCNFSSDREHKFRSNPTCSYQVVASGADGFGMYVWPFSHWYENAGGPFPELHEKLIWVPPYSIMIIRGDVTKAAAGAKDWKELSDLNDHARRRENSIYLEMFFKNEKHDSGKNFKRRSMFTYVKNKASRKYFREHKPMFG